MSALRGTTYNLSFNDLVQAKVQARNQYGWSKLSDSNLEGAHIQNEPEKVINLTENNDLTSELKLVFSWSELITQQQTGGVSILSYNVQWDTGTNGRFWSNLAGYSSNFLATNYTATASIVAG